MLKGLTWWVLLLTVFKGHKLALHHQFKISFCQKILHLHSGSVSFIQAQNPYYEAFLVKNFHQTLHGVDLNTNRYFNVITVKVCG